MFENLSDRLQSAIHKMKGYGKITEENYTKLISDLYEIGRAHV